MGGHACTRSTPPVWLPGARCGCALGGSVPLVAPPSSLCPLVRPMYHGWPSEADAYNAPGQYMFGPSIVVAPAANPMPDGPNGTIAVPVWCVGSTRNSTPPPPAPPRLTPFPPPPRVPVAVCSMGLHQVGMRTCPWQRFLAG